MYLSTPGFQSIDPYPIRSPLIVADYLLPLVRGRRYAEIGAQAGDLLKCLSFYAEKVTAVERMKPMCRKLRSRGIEVVCEDLKAETLAAAAARNETLLPVADVYYWWMNPGQNKVLLNLLATSQR